MLTLPRQLALATFVTALLFLYVPALVFSQPDCLPDDITVRADCDWVEEEIETRLHMHPCPGTIECFKFFRALNCTGTPIWIQIYEGSSNLYCDTEYSYGACVRYRGERWTGINNSGTCTGSPFGSGESWCPSGCSGP
jgi:hypothetical protein